MKELYIKECPLITESCQEEDWHKIAHVPTIEIEDDESAMNDRSIIRRLS